MKSESIAQNVPVKSGAKFTRAGGWFRLNPRVLLILASAVAIGYTVGEGKWQYTLVLVALGCVLWWPVQMSLGIFALLVPFDFIPLLGGKSGTTLTFYVGAASIGILLVEGFMNRRLEMPSRAALWWVLFAAWATVTIEWAMDTEAVILRLPTMLALVVFYLVTASFRITKKEFYATATMAVMGGCLAAIYAAINFYQGGGFQTNQGNRASLVVANNALDPNYFAASLLLPLSLTIAGFLSTRSWTKRMVFMGVIFAIALALLLSMSRGAMVAVVVMTFVYFRRLRVKKGLLIFACAVCVLAIAMVGVPERFYSRWEGASASRGAGRLDIWLVGWAAAKDHGFIGAGLANFPVVYDTYKAAAEVFRGEGRAPHNIYLEVTVELGLVGFLLFVLALRSQMQEARAAGVAAKDAPPELSNFLVACEATCWGMLACGFFLGILWFKMFWLCWIFMSLMVKLLWSSSRQGLVGVHRS